MSNSSIHLTHSTSYPNSGIEPLTSTSLWLLPHQNVYPIDSLIYSSPKPRIATRRHIFKVEVRCECFCPFLPMSETTCTHMPASFSFSSPHRQSGIVMSPFVDCRLLIKTMRSPCAALPWNVGRSLRNCDASSKQNWDQIRGKAHSKNAKNISIKYQLTFSVPLADTQRFRLTVRVAPTTNA